MVYNLDRRWAFPSTGLVDGLKDRFSHRLSDAGSSILALLFPDTCHICDGPLTGSGRIPVCAPCFAAAEPFRPEVFCVRCRTPFLTPHPLDEEGICLACRLGKNHFDAAYCYAAYQGVLPHFIHLFKYERIAPLARPLGRMLALGFPRDVRFDAIVPVPLHWWKRFRRGFNQSQLLARELSRATGLPVWRRLRRARGPAQAGLNARQRRDNVRRRFFVTAGASLAGRRLLLVDDVLTTGATVNACAAELKRAGAAHVSVLTLARADRRPLVPESRAVNPPAPAAGAER